MRFSPPFSPSQVLVHTVGSAHQSQRVDRVSIYLGSLPYHLPMQGFLSFSFLEMLAGTWGILRKKEKHLVCQDDTLINGGGDFLGDHKMGGQSWMKSRGGVRFQLTYYQHLQTPLLSTCNKFPMVLSLPGRFLEPSLDIPSCLVLVFFCWF